MNQVLTVEQNEQKEMLDRIACMYVYISRDQCRPLGGLASTAEAAIKSSTCRGPNVRSGG